MAKGKRAEKPTEEGTTTEEKSTGVDLKEKLRTYFERYGFLAAFAGAVPIQSGILLFQEKECGCFLLPKDILHANNEFLGLISIVAGLVLVLPAIFQYVEESKEKKKILRVRYEYLLAFILAGGLIQFYIGLETQPPIVVDIEGDYDELTRNLTDSGWVLFYSNLCEHCHDQFDMLGTSVKNLRLVDCDTVECPEFIQGYPTWARTNPDGSIEIREGAQTIESLQQMAGQSIL